MDLMASSVSAQCPPARRGESRKGLPFYSRFKTEGTSGVDVSAQNVSKLPGSEQPCFGFCSPPPVHGGNPRIASPSMPSSRGSDRTRLSSVLVSVTSERHD